MTQEGSRRPGRPRTLSPTREEGEPAHARSFVTSLSRGLFVLTQFDSSHPEWNLAEMVARTKLNRATVYRILRTMEQERVLALDRKTGRYHLGPAMYPLAYLTQEHSELVHVARPHLEDLAERTGETASLAVEVDGLVVVVDEVLTSRPSKIHVPLGQARDDLSMADAKLFLAFKPESEQRRRMAGGWPHLTPKTIDDPQELMRQLEAVRVEGVAYDLEEQRQGVCAVSAPVYDVLGRLRAGLDVVVPAERLSPADQERYAAEVKAEALALSRDLGYQSSPDQDVPG